MDSLQIPKRVIEELRKRAEESGSTLEEALIDLVINDANPDEKSQIYLHAAQEFLEQAKRELEKENLRQTSEKIWGAAALAIKAHAYSSEKKRLTSHSELWQHKSKVASELGEWVYDAWNAASAMHTNFYEGWADKQSLEMALERVGSLVQAISQKICEQRG